MTITEEPTNETPAYKWVGTRSIRPDGVEKVTGKARFGADLRLPGMLEGWVLRSPHAHARIRSIDTTAAAAMPGVKAIVTGADFPDLAENGAHPTDVELALNVIARDKVLYEGHVVAAVAATTRAEAHAAADAIVVEYEVLPHVLNVDEAMAEGATLLHPNMMTKGVDPAPTEPSNVASRIVHERGELDQGFADADVGGRAGVHHQAGPPGLHRAPRRRRRHHPGRPVDGVVLVAGPLRHAHHDGQGAGLGAVPPEGHPRRDRRRLRRQDDDLPRAAGRRAVPQVGAAGEAGHEPRRGVPGHRPGVGHPHQGEDGRRQGGQPHRRRDLDGLRGRGVPRLPGRGRRHDGPRPLRHPQLPDRGLRRRRQQAEGGGLPCARRAHGGLRGGERDRRPRP